MAEPRYVYPAIKVGNAVDPFQHQVLMLNASGLWVPRDLSTMTGQLFIMKTRQGVVKVSAACAIPDAVNGWMQYQPTATDLDTAGHYLIEWYGLLGAVPYVSPTIHLELEPRI